MEAIIIFNDIRGFTKWSENPEVNEHIDKFISEYYEILTNFFSSEEGYYFKPLGDGAMIIKESTAFINEKENINWGKIIIDHLTIINKINEKFDFICNKIAHERGLSANLNLGWGIVRGTLKKINRKNDHYDYIGPNVNKCARLCSIARPFGIIIDKEDFIENPSAENFQFYEQIRLLEGIKEPVEVWVTNTIFNNFVPREKIRENPEVHIAGFCFKKEVNLIKVLIAKRNENRKLFPNKYEGCGGQLKYAESFEEGLKRHFSQEMNIEVEVTKEHSFYLINEANNPKIPGIRFLCIYKKGDPKSLHHSKLRWITKEELNDISSDCFIPELKKELLNLFDTVPKYL